MPDGHIQPRQTPAFGPVPMTLGPLARQLLNNVVGSGALNEAQLDALRAILKRASDISRDRFFAPLGPLHGVKPDIAEFAVMGGFIGLARRHALWIRPLAAFRGKRNATPLIAQLARHLLVRWQMPVFMDSVWCAAPYLRPHVDAVANADWSGVGEFRDWYADVGAGQPFDCETAPRYFRASDRKEFNRHYNVTGPDPHIVMQAPDHFHLPSDWDKLLGWSEIRRAGASVEQANNWSNTRLSSLILGTGTDFVPRRAFWRDFVRFLVANPDFPFVQLDPACRYFYEETCRRWPNISMKGRTTRSVLRDLHAWHLRLVELFRRGDAGREPSARSLSANAAWAPSGRRGFVIGAEQNDLFRPSSCWIVTELLSARDLAAEGANLEHCVLLYGRKCQAGQVSIWSLRRAGPHSPLRRRLTIEVTSDGQIVQARGPRNRWPRWDEWAVLKAWAEAAGLEVKQAAPVQLAAAECA